MTPYWQLDYPDADEQRAQPVRDEAEAAEELRALLIDATRIRLRADVPVGAYLSGGLDSSALTALIKRFTDSRLRTFSVGFETAGVRRERATSRRWSGRWAPSTSPSLCTRSDIGRMFPDVIRHTERPVIRTAPAPLFQLARLVRENGFKVVMTGEGADEVLGGYDIFKEDKVRRFWARQPAVAAAAAAAPPAVPVPVRHPGAVAGVPGGVLPGRPGPTGRPVLLAPAAVGGDRKDQGVLLRTTSQPPSTGTTRSRTCAEPPRRNTPPGTRCPRRSTWKPPTCCPATSSRRRATGWRWPTRSRGGSRSSTTGWSSSRPSCRRG